MSFDPSLTAPAVPAPASDPVNVTVARFVDLAGSALSAPVVYIWIEDDTVGGPACATAQPAPRLLALSQRVVETGRPLVVHHGDPDAFATGLDGDGVVAYIGAPLRTTDGTVLGALCAVDRRVRLWTTEEVSTLETIARAISGELELRVLR